MKQDGVIQIGLVSEHEVDQNTTSNMTISTNIHMSEATSASDRPILSYTLVTIPPPRVKILSGKTHVLSGNLTIK